MRTYLNFQEIGEAVAEYYVGSYDKVYGFGEFILNTYLPTLTWPELKVEKDAVKATALLWDLACAKTAATNR